MKCIEKFWHFLTTWFWLGPIGGPLFFYRAVQLQKETLPTILRVAFRGHTVYLIADPAANENELIETVTLRSDLFTDEFIKEQTADGKVILRIEKL